MVVVLIGGGLLAYNKDVTGLSAIVVALVSLVTVFVYGRSKDNEIRPRRRYNSTERAGCRMRRAS